MKNYQRICVLGNSGSGKSTISFKLAEMLKLPLYHLDKIYWQPNWVATPKEEVVKRVRDIASLEQWIIDGNNKSTMIERFERADAVIYLDYSPIFCLWRVIRRALTTVVRADMAEGCKERINWGFCKYVLSYNKRVRPKVWALIEAHKFGFDFYHIKSGDDMEKLFEIWGEKNND